MALTTDLLGTNPITDLTATVNDSLTSLTGDILGTNQTLAGAQDSVTGGAATGDSLLQTLDGLTGTLQDLAGGLPVVGPQLTDAVSTLTSTVGGLTAGVPLDAATLGQITSQLNTITDLVSTSSGVLPSELQAQLSSITSQLDAIIGGVTGDTGGGTDGSTGGGTGGSTGGGSTDNASNDALAQSILALQQAVNALKDSFAESVGRPQDVPGGLRTVVGTKKADILSGQAGADLFVFNTKLGKKNIDTIFNFESGTDTIALDKKFFKALQSQEELSFVDFAARISTKIVVVGGQQSLELSYDTKPFKAGGEKAFAVLVGVTDIQAADFMVL